METRQTLKRAPVLSKLLDKYEEIREVAKKAEEEKKLLFQQIQNEMVLAGCGESFSEVIGEEVRIASVDAREKYSVSYEKLKILVSQRTLDKVTTITPYVSLTVRRKKA